MSNTTKQPYGICPDTEAYIPLPNGGVFAFPDTKTDPFGCDYVRVLDATGGEIGYWIRDEWCGSPEQSAEVMGAICGAMLATKSPTEPKYYKFGPNSILPEGVEEQGRPVKKKYRTGNLIVRCEIVEVEIDRETEHSIWISGRTIPERKRSDSAIYHDTRKEAIAFLKEKAELRLESASRELQRARENFIQLEQMEMIEEEEDRSSESDII